jgi:hypothetical protein
MFIGYVPLRSPLAAELRGVGAHDASNRLTREQPLKDI